MFSASPVHHLCVYTSFIKGFPLIPLVSSSLLMLFLGRKYGIFIYLSSVVVADCKKLV